EIQVQTRRGVALVDEDVPEGEGILAARDRDQHGLVVMEHAVLVDGLADLLAEELQEVGRAECRVVPPQLDGGGPTTLATLHASTPAPPDITGRISSSSSSPTTVSVVR